MKAYDILPIDYYILPNPLPDEQGRTTYQVRQDTRGAINTRGIVEYLRANNMMPSYPIDAIIETLTKAIVEKLFFNACVHIDGLGVFSLNIGLKPVIDENGVAHKRQVTDPNDITGNEIEVTGISFKPDKEFLKLATERPARFRHTEPRGVVGRHPVFTREEMIASLFAYLDKYHTISRGVFVVGWNLTRHQATKWLKELSTGDNPPLLETRPTNAYVYQRNPNYVPET